MNKVGIIGFGRFGNLLYEILKKGFEVEVFDINPCLLYTSDAADDSLV